MLKGIFQFCAYHDSRPIATLATRRRRHWKPLPPTIGRTKIIAKKRVKFGAKKPKFNLFRSEEKNIFCHERETSFEGGQNKLPKNGF
jgi:hypothetical protein